MTKRYAMYRVRLILTGLVFILVNQVVVSQQLKLGNNPYTVQKSAVLDMESTNQGLLLVRISDTTLINALTPPDGMIIYFTPSKLLYTRSNGVWKPVPLAGTTTPIYYNGTGGSATVNQVTKVWMADINNNGTGNPSVTIPANVEFTNILSIQLTTEGGSSAITAPIAMVTSHTSSSISIRVVNGAGIVAAGNSLVAHTDTNTKIYIRVEGN